MNSGSSRTAVRKTSTKLFEDISTINFQSANNLPVLEFRAAHISTYNQAFTVSEWTYTWLAIWYLVSPLPFSSLYPSNRQARARAQARDYPYTHLPFAANRLGAEISNVNVIQLFTALLIRVHSDKVLLTVYLPVPLPYSPTLIPILIGAIS